MCNPKRAAAGQMCDSVYCQTLIDCDECGQVCVAPAGTESFTCRVCHMLGDEPGSYSDEDVALARTRVQREALAYMRFFAQFNPRFKRMHAAYAAEVGV